MLLVAVFQFKIGDFMILKDHFDLNALTGRNPLVGLNDPEWGPRFVPMHDAYDRALQKLGLEGIIHYKLSNMTHTI